MMTTGVYGTLSDDTKRSPWSSSAEGTGRSGRRAATNRTAKPANQPMSMKLPEAYDVWLVRYTNPLSARAMPVRPSPMR